MAKLSDMTEEELKVLSNRKKKNGCYTYQALQAQMELWDRVHYPIDNDVEENWGGYYDNGYSVTDVLTMQY